MKIVVPELVSRWWLTVISVPFIAAYAAGTVDDGCQAQAIERGYALYCPETGDFAWEGECGE